MRPFERAEHAVENDKDQQDGQRHDDEQPRFGALFAFVFAFPVDVIAARQLNFRGYVLDRFLDRAAQVAAAHAVLDGDIALVSFPVDLGTAVPFFHLAELRERNSFAGGSQQTNVLDGFLGVAELRQIAHHQVVARLALQNLRESIPSRGGIDGVLNIRDVDLIARGLLAIDDEVVVGLAQNLKHSQVLNPLDLAHDFDDLVRLCLREPASRRHRPWWQAVP